MRELFVLFYLAFEFVIFVQWTPKLIRTDKNLWENLRQIKIPLLVLLTLCLMLQIYIAIAPDKVMSGEKNTWLLIGELLIKAGFFVVITTRIMMAVSTHEYTSEKIKKADTLLNWATITSMSGFIFRSCILLPQIFG